MIDAIFYDGHSTRRQPVTLVIHKRVLVLRGAGGLRRAERLSRIDVSERLQHAPRILRFRDGAFIEIDDPGLDKLLRRNGYRDPWAVRWQQNWALSLCALIALLAVLISGYQWGLPWAADRIALHLPASIADRVGDAELKMIDARYMAPSALSGEDQARIRHRFAVMAQPRGEHTRYRLEFRRSKVGPNAFALPNGVIVMTDELVRMSGSDDAVLGVLGHELGHLQRRHTLRNLLQAVGVGVLLNLWVGDVSSVLAAVPTFLLNQAYSRDFEREADLYAIDMMQVNGLPLTPMAELFEKMHGADAADAETADSPEHEGRGRDGREVNEDGEGDEGDERVSDYFSSHPGDAERIARLRAADANRAH